LHPGTFFLEERVLDFTLEIAVQFGGDGYASKFLRIGFMQWSSTPVVAKLGKPTVGLGANHHPM
jgi:hypothetical protein